MVWKACRERVLVRVLILFIRLVLVLGGFWVCWCFGVAVGWEFGIKEGRIG